MIRKKGGLKMPRTLDTKEYLDTVCDLLARGSTCVPVPVAGTSMVPFLHPGDTVYLDLADSPLKKGDIVLFTRPDGRYVLHRIVKCNPDGSFVLLGDAQTQRETVDGIHRIHARVTGAACRGKLLNTKSPRWRFYATLWQYLEPVRPRLLGLGSRLSRLKRKTR